MDEERVDGWARIDAVLRDLPGLTVAVSGGVDSLTLAHLAARLWGGVRAVHAVSPAVPPSATARVRTEAAAGGWELLVVEAGEFADPDYLRNPLNRCYFCKSNLYRRIAASVEGPVAAGTNLDDLGEYRPGLAAAAEKGVRHPFVEAGLAKSAVRALARGLGLGGVAELPAQPCLASRVETGIPIDARDLAFVDRVETATRALSGAEDVRCRITAQGVRLELSATPTPEVVSLFTALCASEGRAMAGLGPYRRGSAFLGAPG
jgi:uncharacterized protein